MAEENEKAREREKEGCNLSKEVVLKKKVSEVSDSGAERLFVIMRELSRMSKGVIILDIWRIIYYFKISFGSKKQSKPPTTQ